jgi:3-oxoacyl-[acyl-carrier-protein] synthase III
VTRVSLAAVASYLPDRWMTAAEVAAETDIPEDVIAEKFGLRGKHIAAPDEHVSDMAVTVGERLLDDAGIDPESIDVVLYFGSMWKDYPVWQAGPAIAHRLGCANAYAVEYANVSYGAPAALRVGRDILVAEPDVQRVLAVGASRESYLLDYANERARFMINFGDGAAAALLVKNGGVNEILGSHGITDGSLARHVKVPSGGSVDPDGENRSLDVIDQGAMKERLDEISLPNFVRAAEGALERSGASLADVAYLCGIHMKRSMHDALVEALGVSPKRAAYLDDAGHMSGVDPLLALDRAQGQLADGDLVLLLAAGTGYTWAASVVRWGNRHGGDI